MRWKHQAMPPCHPARSTTFTCSLQGLQGLQIHSDYSLSCSSTSVTWSFSQHKLWLAFVWALAGRWTCFWMFKCPVTVSIRKNYDMERSHLMFGDSQVVSKQLWISLTCVEFCERCHSDSSRTMASPEASERRETSERAVTMPSAPHPPEFLLGSLYRILRSILQGSTCSTRASELSEDWKTWAFGLVNWSMNVFCDVFHMSGEVGAVFKIQYT